MTLGMLVVKMEQDTKSVTFTMKPTHYPFYVAVSKETEIRGQFGFISLVAKKFFELNGRI